GERGCTCTNHAGWDAPLPGPLPTPSSWGEGTSFGRNGGTVEMRPAAAPLHSVHLRFVFYSGTILNSSGDRIWVWFPKPSVKSAGHRQDRFFATSRQSH